MFFCLDAKEPKNQDCGCFATRSLHFAVRIANSRFALKQRCSLSLRSGRSLYAHRPRPLLLSLAFGIGEFFKSCRHVDTPSFVRPEFQKLIII